MSAKDCAKAIRTELKQLYPQIKFSVTSENFAGGDAVRVGYTDGVKEKDIEEVLKKYEYGSFDGMTDSYDYNNVIEGLAQVKYVTLNRTISNEIEIKVKRELATKWNILNIKDEGEWRQKSGNSSYTQVYREFRIRDF